MPLFQHQWWRKKIGVVLRMGQVCSFFYCFCFSHCSGVKVFCENACKWKKVQLPFCKPKRYKYERNLREFSLVLLPKPHWQDGAFATKVCLQTLPKRSHIQIFRHSHRTCLWPHNELSQVLSQAFLEWSLQNIHSCLEKTKMIFSKLGSWFSKGKSIWKWLYLWRHLIMVVVTYWMNLSISKTRKI